MTLQTALSRYIDINTPPSQKMLRQMVAFATNLEEQNLLEQLAEVNTWENIILKLDLTL